tara:strand:+ start:2163 stop:3062 length:900 start_codon:yes stop_codon:yes gene_type:complete
MAVNKNFVVKNGIEVGTRLIVADTQNTHVGLGTTAPLTTLDVRGDVRFADDGGTTVNTVDIAGITTFRKDVNIGVGATTVKVDVNNGYVGINSASPSFALDVKAGAGDTLAASFDNDIFAPNLIVSGGSINYIVAIAATIGTLGVTGVATANQLVVSGLTTLAQNGGITTTGGDLYVGGDLFVKDDVVYDEVTGRNLNITGVGTINGVKIGDPSGIVTASSASGIVTYFGDGSNLTGTAPSLVAAVGVSSGGTLIGAGATMIDFAAVNATITATPTVSGVSTVTVTPSVSLGLVIALGA